MSLNLFLLAKAFSYLNLSLNCSIYLYIFISCIIIFRLYIDQRTSEKETLMCELKTLINEISESIEESFSLDTAIRNTFSTIKLKNLQDDISNFCKLHNYNIQNEIVNFFKTLATKHSIKEFKNYIQLLSLELKFNHTPVNIFKEINIFLNNQEKNRKKFNNSYKLINLSIDFMLVFYYLNLLILIPKLNSSNPAWFTDTSKDLGIFISSILFWLVYISSHIFLNKKKGDLL
ncbi:MAG: hypothetical protein HRT47_02710 [Candidatus Caenarcaniphilales bacterium]|nr:hypothetical protein [Candidatus Caenarcaniphilales bacterium]